MSDQIEQVVEGVENSTVDTNTEDVMASVNYSDTDPVVSAKALLEAGAHLGHQARRWNPKMKNYIYGTRNGIHLIDLTKTVSKLQEAYLALRNIADITTRKGKVLFVGTKPQASEIIKEEAIRSGSFYVNTKWLGGTLTNFKTLSKRAKLLKKLQDDDNEGVLDTLPKKDAVAKRKLISKLSLTLDGIKEMLRIPDALVVVDPVNEHNAVAEARILNIPVFGLVDTNCDPNSVDYAIPCNDDSIKTIKLIVGILADAVVVGKGSEPLYAYHTDNEVFATMDDAMKNYDKVEELRLIKIKFREDSYILKGKGKNNKQARYNQARRSASAEEKPVVAVETASEEQTEKGE